MLQAASPTPPQAERRTERNVGCPPNMGYPRTSRGTDNNSRGPRAAGQDEGTTRLGQAHTLTAAPAPRPGWGDTWGFERPLESQRGSFTSSWMDMQGEHYKSVSKKMKEAYSFLCKSVGCARWSPFAPIPPSSSQPSQGLRRRLWPQAGRGQGKVPRGELGSEAPSPPGHQRQVPLLKATAPEGMGGGGGGDSLCSILFPEAIKVLAYKSYSFSNK